MYSWHLAIVSICAYYTDNFCSSYTPTTLQDTERIVIHGKNLQETDIKISLGSLSQNRDLAYFNVSSLNEIVISLQEAFPIVSVYLVRYWKIRIAYLASESFFDSNE
ncbi:hypothetical protein NPIL_294901 [Nephila pilipes]|uniref:Uncharacterized protein n=1 Tax=Nephila pilipes TaxID=299642 RepID=A0A8X6QJJ3_NEPPI|nr:hypothetical protein NPIL_294901 [Nephila pilipes]